MNDWIWDEKQEYRMRMSKVNFIYISTKTNCRHDVDNGNEVIANIGNSDEIVLYISKNKGKCQEFINNLTKES